VKSGTLAALLLLAVLLLALTSASAQVRLSTGLKTGLNLATVYGDDAEGVDLKAGFVSGFSIALYFGDAVALQSEILYCMKGTQYQEGPLTTKVKLGYIEVPLLAKFTFSTDAEIDPFVYTGPAVATNVSAKLGYSVSGSGSTDINVDNVKSTDLGWVIGGGVVFDLPRTRASLEVRYERGFVEFVDEPVPNGTNIVNNGVAQDWKHSDIALMLGVYF
jgi:hypothetical protein